MASTNGITGDKMISRPATNEYDEGWERIFGKKKERDDEIQKGVEETEDQGICGEKGGRVEGRS